MLAKRLITIGATLFFAAGALITKGSIAHAKVTSVTKPSSKSSPNETRRKRGRGRFDGRTVSDNELRVSPLPRPSGRVVISSPGFKEDAEVNIYNDDGSLNQGALAKLDRLFRCRKTNEERAMDPRLYEILSLLYDHFGQPIEVNSGFRYQRNEGSRHFHGSAMDITIAKVNYRDVYTYATTLDRGGMGIGRYPIGNFVHIDFRAPGEPSYRWTDTHGSGGNDPGKLPSKMWKRSSKPNT
jgi:uncharacterized protein YcbK (DUF882 family)